MWGVREALGETSGLRAESSQPSPSPFHPHASSDARGERTARAPQRGLRLTSTSRACWRCGSEHSVCTAVCTA
eukprot:1262141-Rhodomonas_salina.1